MRRLSLLPLALAAALGHAPPPLPAGAQVEVFAPVEALDFDEPEAWAMKYFSSASLMTGLGVVPARRAGEIDVAFEGLWIPPLDQEQRTVGFGGFKEEDLNRSELFARVRLAVGIGARTSLVVGAVPPATIQGLKPRLVAFAIERPLIERRRWMLGARLFAQTGSVEGDLTCTDEDARFPAGSPENAFGCEERSSDEVELDHVGFELRAGYRLSERWALHFGGSVQEHDLEFQVDALTFGFRDRTRLLADGTTWAASAGLELALGERLRLAGELFYTPLDRRRFGRPESSANPTIGDELVSARTLLIYRAR